MGPARLLAPQEEEAGRHAVLPDSSGAPPGLIVGTARRDLVCRGEAELAEKRERCGSIS